MMRSLLFLLGQDKGLCKILRSLTIFCSSCRATAAGSGTRVALEWGYTISTSIVPHCAVRYLLIELSGTLLDWTTVPQLYCTVPSAALDHPHEMVYAGGVDADPTIRS